MQNTRITKKKLRELHVAMLDLIVLMNQPQRDQALLAEAGVPLDRALFPLLVGIERFGPIGVVELSERAGRDYTTVSRQVAKLESLGLIERRPSPADRRVHEAVITDKGRQTTDALDAARQKLATRILSKWSEEDINNLVRLMRRLVDDLKASSSETDET